MSIKYEELLAGATRDRVIDKHVKNSVFTLQRREMRDARSSIKASTVLYCKYRVKPWHKCDVIMICGVKGG